MEPEDESVAILLLLGFALVLYTLVWLLAGPPPA